MKLVVHIMPLCHLYTIFNFQASIKQTWQLMQTCEVRTSLNRSFENFEQ